MLPGRLLLPSRFAPGQNISHPAAFHQRQFRWESEPPGTDRLHDRPNYVFGLAGAGFAGALGNGAAAGSGFGSMLGAGVAPGAGANGALDAGAVAGAGFDGTLGDATVAGEPLVTGEGVASWTVDAVGDALCGVDLHAGQCCPHSVHLGH
jgi:hypothetical protein